MNISSTRAVARPQTVSRTPSSPQAETAPATSDQVSLSDQPGRPPISKVGVALGAIIGGLAGVAAGQVGGIAGVAMGLPAAVAGGFALGGAAWLAAKKSDSIALEDGAGPAGAYLGFVGTAVAAGFGGPIGAAVVGLGSAAVGGLLLGRLGGDAGVA